MDIHVAIVEDDPIIRNSLETYLNTCPGIAISYSADSVESLISTLKVARNPQIDLVLLDIGLPGISGLEGIKPIKRMLPETNIVMLTTYEEEEKIFKALCAGAVSYLSKRSSLPKIQEAITTIHRGGSYMSPSIARKVVEYFSPNKQKNEAAQLTPRQQEIVHGIMEGLSYKLIADKLMISIDTVRDHIKKIYKTLNINSKSELMKKAMKGEIEGYEME
ncbi:MAG: response regulator transcription factor [Bacteroidota bacterium]